MLSHIREFFGRRYVIVSTYDNGRRHNGNVAFRTRAAAMREIMRYMQNTPEFPAQFDIPGIQYTISRIR